MRRPSSSSARITRWAICCACAWAALGLGKKKSTQRISACPAHLTEYAATSLCRRQLLEDTEVTFGGYRIQHPLEPAIQVKVQTKSDNPGPVQAIDQALSTLEKELDTFERRFTEALKHAGKDARGGAGGGGLGGGYDAMDLS
jgi:DNA-directed RNA polymerase, subunit L